MTRPKRFRGMELSEDDVDSILMNRCDGHTYSDQARYLWNLRIEARAKRLLPLWRKVGIRAIIGHAFLAGVNSLNKDKI